MSSAIVITGASSGLGRKVAELLAPDPRWQVVLACRDPRKAEAVRIAIQPSAANPVLTVPLELESLGSVRAFPAALALAGVESIGGLVCNAGVQDVAEMRRTTDGFERTFGVNHLAHFALTQLLMDRLESNARIVVVSSNTHDPSTDTGIPPPRYHDPRELAVGVDEGPDPVVAGRIRYSTSKLCNVYFARELARRLDASGDARLRSIRVAAFDPGMMPGTGLAREYGALIRFAWSYLLPVLTLGGSNVNTVRRSGLRLAKLFSEATPSWSSGAYLSGGVVTAPSAEALDPVRARDLWECSDAVLRGGSPPITGHSFVQVAVQAKEESL
jgi:NAD(P)-dependent dehydrogenase (short-subunit alcohol dehydrogenase family)